MNGLAEPIELIAAGKFDGIRPLGMIGGMELEDVITIAEALEIAEGMGHELSASYVARTAKSGRISDSRKSGRVWLMGRSSFLDWLNSRRSPGRPIEKSD